MNQYRQWLSDEKKNPEELEEYNFKCCIDILKFAYEHTRFYKQRLDSVGIHPSDIRNRDDWNKIPVLNKNDVRMSFQDLRVDNAREEHCVLTTTGGSTGEPLTVLKDNRFPSSFFSWIPKRWVGIPIGSNGAYLGRIQNSSTSSNKRKYSLSHFFNQRNCRLDASHITQKDFDDFVSQVYVRRPLWFYGYVGTIAQFAEYCLDNSIHFNFLRAVITTSAPLTSNVRLLIQNAFNVPVYDQYGSCEVSWIATQCECNRNLHVHSNLHYVELLDNNNQPVQIGEYGTVTVTDFVNHVFPLIRYRLGDTAKFVHENCPCGRPFPLIEPIKGRVSDNIFLPNESTTVSGEFLTTIFDDYPHAVRSFQIYQHKDYSIDLKVVPNKEYSNADKEIKCVYDKLHRNMGDIDFRLIYVNKIYDDRGKSRFVISELSSLRR